MLKRQTKLSLKELRKRLASTETSVCPGDLYPGDLPRGLLLNEIGTMFCHGNSEAEKDLVALLKGTQVGSSVAIFYLNYGIDLLSPAAKKALINFQKNPTNKKVVKFALDSLANFKEKERTSNQ